MDSEGVESVALLPCPFTDALLEKLIAAVLAHCEVGVDGGEVREIRMNKRAVKADMVETLTAFSPQDKRIAVLEEALREILAKESGAGYDPIQALGEIEHIARAALNGGSNSQE